MICRQDVSTWRTKGVLYRRSPNYKNYSSDIFIGGSQRSARCYWSTEGAQAANKVLRSYFRLIDTVLKRSVTFARCCHCILFYRGWLRLRTVPLDVERIELTYPNQAPFAAVRGISRLRHTVSRIHEIPRDTGKETV
jgi:hypothetical protein